MKTPPILSHSATSPWRAVFIGLLFAGVVVSAFTMPRLQATTQTPLAVVYAPWWSTEAVMSATAQTGADILGAGIAPNILIVRASDARALRKLYAQGAWSVLNIASAPDCIAANLERPA